MCKVILHSQCLFTRQVDAKKQFSNEIDTVKSVIRHSLSHRPAFFIAHSKLNTAVVVETAGRCCPLWGSVPVRVFVPCYQRRRVVITKVQKF